MKASEARLLAAQAAERRKQAEELSAATALLLAENTRLHKQAESTYERILGRARRAALAAAERGEPLIYLSATDSNALALALETAESLAATDYSNPLLLPPAFTRINADSALGCARAAEVRSSFETLQKQVRNARKLEYLDRVRRRREYIVKSVERADPSDLETFDEVYVLDVQRQLESEILVPDPILDECAKKLTLKIPGELRVTLTGEILKPTLTPNLDLLLSLIPKSLDDKSLLMVWRLDSVKDSWKGTLSTAANDAPHKLLDQGAYLPPDKSSDPLSNPDLLPWVAQRSRVAFQPLFAAVASSAEGEVNEITLRILSRSSDAPKSESPEVDCEISLIRLQSLGLPIDDFNQASSFVEAFLTALEYTIEQLNSDVGNVYRLSWSN